MADNRRLQALVWWYFIAVKKRGREELNDYNYLPSSPVLIMSMKRCRIEYGEPIVAKFNTHIFVQFNAYMHANLISQFIPFNSIPIYTFNSIQILHLIHMFAISIQFNSKYIFSSIQIYRFNSIQKIYI